MGSDGLFSLFEIASMCVLEYVSVLLAVCVCICVSICLSGCVSVFLYVFVCLSVCLAVYLQFCIQVGDSEYLYLYFSLSGFVSAWLCVFPSVCHTACLSMQGYRSVSD